MVRTSILSTVALTILASSTNGFSVAPQNVGQKTTDTTSLNMFGGLKGAFANEEMGARKNDGLSNGPDYNENVTVNGKAIKGSVVGQKLTVVAGRARVKIPVNCQKGDCGTCMVNMNGRKVKACQALLPKGKTAINTL